MLRMAIIHTIRGIIHRAVPFNAFEAGAASSTTSVESELAGEASRFRFRRAGTTSALDSVPGSAMY
jgi:hypothetical protein